MNIRGIIKKERTNVISISLTKEIIDTLDKEAVAKNINRSSLYKQILLEHIEQNKQTETD